MVLLISENDLGWVILLRLTADDVYLSFSGYLGGVTLGLIQGLFANWLLFVEFNAVFGGIVLVLSSERGEGVT